jgi:hypothetical protein
LQRLSEHLARHSTGGEDLDDYIDHTYGNGSQGDA